MTKRRTRGQGEGSIYQRQDGLWVAAVNLGWKGGKRDRKYYYGKTRAEVAEKLNDALHDRQRGLPVRCAEVVDQRRVSVHRALCGPPAGGSGRSPARSARATAPGRRCARPASTRPTNGRNRSRAQAAHPDHAPRPLAATWNRCTRPTVPVASGFPHAAQVVHRSGQPQPPSRASRRRIDLTVSGLRPIRWAMAGLDSAGSAQAIARCCSSVGIAMWGRSPLVRVPRHGSRILPEPAPRGNRPRPRA